MKLVRDKIPEMHPEYEYHRALPTERLLLLQLKLAEETGEFLSAPTLQGRLEELADVLEVFEALHLASGFSFADLEEARRSKRIAKGAFIEGWVLE